MIAGRNLGLLYFARVVAGKAALRTGTKRDPALRVFVLSRRKRIVFDPFQRNLINYIGNGFTRDMFMHRVMYRKIKEKPILGEASICTVALRYAYRKGPVCSRWAQKAQRS